MGRDAIKQLRATDARFKNKLGEEMQFEMEQRSHCGKSFLLLKNEALSRVKYNMSSMNSLVVRFIFEIWKKECLITGLLKLNHFYCSELIKTQTKSK